MEGKKLKIGFHSEDIIKYLVQVYIMVYQPKFIHKENQMFSGIFSGHRNAIFI